MMQFAKEQTKVQSMAEQPWHKLRVRNEQPEHRANQVEVSRFHGCVRESDQRVFATDVIMSAIVLIGLFGAKANVCESGFFGCRRLEHRSSVFHLPFRFFFF